MADGAEVVGVVVALTFFSFTRKGYAAAAGLVLDERFIIGQRNSPATAQGSA